MLREQIRTSLTILITSWILLSGVIIMPVSLQEVEGQEARGSSNFTEDFYMTAYMDGNKTDVVGWGSGSIELLKKPKVTDLSLTGSCNTPKMAMGIFVEGNYAYVGTSGSGLYVINITDPTNPFIVGNYDAPVNVWGVYIVENYAYISSDYTTWGLLIINITNPLNPTLEGFCDTPAPSYGLHVVGNYAYVTFCEGFGYGEGTGLKVIDITDPKNPISVYTYYTIDYTYDVYILNDYAYIAEYEFGGLEIINITDPKNLNHVGRYDTLGRAKGVYVEGNYAYIADHYGNGLQVIDVSDPTNPTLVSSYSLYGFSNFLQVVKNYVYISGTDLGLQVINITHSNNPTLAARWNIPDPANHNFTNDVFVMGNYAYVANASGLQIIEIWFSDEKRYQTSGIAQSLKIDTTNNYIYHASLTCENNIPSDTSIQYYLSADGGDHWDLVTPEIEHSFKNPGNDLRWKAILSTSNYSVTPTISKISISYEFDTTTPDSKVELIVPYWHNSTRFDIGWKAIDNYNLENLTLFYRYSIDNITWTDWIEYSYNKTVTGTFQNGNFSFIATMGDGYYWFCTVGIDLSGNLESIPLLADAIAGVDTSWPSVNPPEAYGKYNNAGTVKWSWVPSPDTGSGIIGYYVCIGTTIGGSEIVKDDFTTNNWYQISGLQNNNTYYCKIKAKNGARTIGSYRNGDFVTVDTMPPYLLSILINNGANETHILFVNLTLKATDYPSGVDQMSFSSNGVNWSAWESFSPTKSYTLPSGNGLKTVYFKVKDKAGNIAPPVSDTIILNIPESINDTDNDGYNDNIEDLVGTNPYDPNSIPADLDKDYIPDLFDPDIDGDGKLNEDDQYPYNPKKWKEDETDIELYLTILIIAFAIMIILIIINIKKYFRFGKK